MTIHFGVRVTRRISRYIIPFAFDGFNSAGRSWAQLRLQSSESNGMALYLWGLSGLISKPEMGIYVNLNTNYEFDIICEKEAMNIYCNGILRVSVSDFGHQPVQWHIGMAIDPIYDFDSDIEFYDIFCINKALKPDPNKPIGEVFHPEYCYHHMYDDFGTKIG